MRSANKKTPLEAAWSLESGGLCEQLRGDREGCASAGAVVMGRGVWREGGLSSDGGRVAGTSHYTRKKCSGAPHMSGSSLPPFFPRDPEDRRLLSLTSKMWKLRLILQWGNPSWQPRALGGRVEFFNYQFSHHPSTVQRKWGLSVLGGGRGRT